jgi:hypothetical protein
MFSSKEMVMNLDKLTEGLEDFADTLEGVKKKKKSKFRKRVEKWGALWLASASDLVQIQVLGLAPL